MVVPAPDACGLQNIVVKGIAFTRDVIMECALWPDSGTLSALKANGHFNSRSLQIRLLGLGNASEQQKEGIRKFNRYVHVQPCHIANGTLPMSVCEPDECGFQQRRRPCRIGSGDIDRYGLDVAM